MKIVDINGYARVEKAPGGRDRTESGDEWGRAQQGYYAPEYEEAD